MLSRRHALLAVLGMAFSACTYSPATSPATATPPNATVVWVSIDGFRGDYVDRTHAPFFSRLMATGAYTRQLRPVFPTITFTSHTSEATGVPVGSIVDGEFVGHGIPANDFYDLPSQTKYVFPFQATLVKAAPIWKTATIQAIRTEVFDWPFSQMQSHPPLPAYFDPNKYDGKMADEQRIERWVSTYEKDSQPNPLRLVMGYVETLDKAGHKYGPDAAEMNEAVLKVDAQLSAAFDRFNVAWQKKSQRGDLLIFLVTTDHGMSMVHHVVNFQHLLGLADASPVITVTSGPIGCIFLPDDSTRAATATSLLARLQGKPYLHAYRREDLPARWAFDDKDRVGDIVVVLDTGYTFSTKPAGEIAPVGANLEITGPLGMHGYPVESDRNMEGLAIAWRSDHAWTNRDIGPADAIQIYGTVARWLHMRPAPHTAPPLPGL